MRTFVLPCAVAVTASVLSAGSGIAAATAVPAATRCQPGAYVSISSGRVRPVDLVTRKVGQPIVLPMPSGSRRQYAGPIVVTANGKTAYAYNTSNEGRWLTPINTATNKTGPPIPLLDFQAPLMVATANSKNLYVGGRDLWLINPPATTFAKMIAFPHTGQVVNLYLANGGATLYAQSPTQLTPVSTVTNTPGPSVAMPFEPFGVAIAPNGTTAYLTNWNKSTVVPLNLATGVAGKPIKPVGLQPDQILITPNGSTVYVEANDSGIVTPISTRTNKVGKAFKFWGPMIMTPNGTTLFVLSQNGVIPISTKTNTAGRPIKISGVQDMVITPDSKTAWVIAATGKSATGNSIVSINVATGKVGKPIPVAGGPSGIALRSCPD